MIWKMAEELVSWDLSFFLFYASLILGFLFESLSDFKFIPFTKFIEDMLFMCNIITDGPLKVSLMQMRILPTNLTRFLYLVIFLSKAVISFLQISIGE